MISNGIWVLTEWVEYRFPASLFMLPWWKSRHWISPTEKSRLFNTAFLKLQITVLVFRTDCCINSGYILCLILRQHLCIYCWQHTVDWNPRPSCSTRSPSVEHSDRRGMSYLSLCVKSVGFLHFQGFNSTNRCNHAWFMTLQHSNTSYPFLSCWFAVLIFFRVFVVHVCVHSLLAFCHFVKNLQVDNMKPESLNYGCDFTITW